jgi:hypothetical protein
MEACFLIEDSFEVPSRPGLFVVGQPTTGTITAGMVASTWLEGDRWQSATIAAVEFVHREGGLEVPVLHLLFATPKDLAVFRELSPPGTELRVR